MTIPDVLQGARRQRTIADQGHKTGEAVFKRTGPPLSSSIKLGHTLKYSGVEGAPHDQSVDNRHIVTSAWKAKITDYFGLLRSHSPLLPASNQAHPCHHLIFLIEATVSRERKMHHVAAIGRLLPWFTDTVDISSRYREVILKLLIGNLNGRRPEPSLDNPDPEERHDMMLHTKRIVRIN